jgi:carbamoyltransferase
MEVVISRRLCLGMVKGNQFDVLDSIDFPHSVGIFYSALTQFLGFPHYGDEYKVMGLAHMATHSF